ncbi:MAG: hypothetical protein A2V98_08400 [Planctomycetes bacterium RBG_16_64_12]|nr:MAG: hypothetical protein A2V98_08400 [Planctomycetes bacterium RBG_16_64_12]
MSRAKDTTTRDELVSYAFVRPYRRAANRLDNDNKIRINKTILIALMLETLLRAEDTILAIRPPTCFGRDPMSGG